jgi:hypothetical protein
MARTGHLLPTPGFGKCNLAHPRKENTVAAQACMRMTTRTRAPGQRPRHPSAVRRSLVLDHGRPGRVVRRRTLCATQGRVRALVIPMTS